MRYNFSKTRSDGVCITKVRPDEVYLSKSIPRFPDEVYPEIL
jgi:hypothetical protein